MLLSIFIPLHSSRSLMGRVREGERNNLSMTCFSIVMLGQKASFYIEGHSTQGSRRVCPQLLSPYKMEYLVIEDHFDHTGKTMYSCCWLVVLMVVHWPIDVCVNFPTSCWGNRVHTHLVHFFYYYLEGLKREKLCQMISAYHLLP